MAWSRIGLCRRLMRNLVCYLQSSLLPSAQASDFLGCARHPLQRLYSHDWELPWTGRGLGRHPKMEGLSIRSGALTRLPCLWQSLRLGKPRKAFSQVSPNIRMRHDRSRIFYVKAHLARNLNTLGDDFGYKIHAFKSTHPFRTIFFDADLFCRELEKGIEAFHKRIY